MSYFVALTMPDDVQEQFVNRTAMLADHFQTIHPVHFNQHHLTVAFLGELSKSELSRTKAVLGAVKGYRMHLETADLDMFGHGILVQKLKKEPLLFTLQKRVTRSLEKAEIHFDKKPFVPHVTLARACACDFFHPRVWVSDEPIIKIPVTALTLMRSQQGKYQVIEKYPLALEPIQYVYILICGDGSYYTGWTNHLNARVKAHQCGRGAKYTKSHQPVELVYYEEYGDQRTAMRREYACKQMSRTEKEQLIDKKHPSSSEHVPVLKHIEQHRK